MRRGFRGVRGVTGAQTLARRTFLWQDTSAGLSRRCTGPKCQDILSRYEELKDACRPNRCLLLVSVQKVDFLTLFPQPLSDTFHD